MNKSITNGRITKWMLLMQYFNIDVQGQPGKVNQVTDFLSRLNSPGDPNLVLDNFPDEHLFDINVKTPWHPTISLHKQKKTKNN